MEYSQLQVYFLKILVYCRSPWFMDGKIFTPLPTIHMNHIYCYENTLALFPVLRKVPIFINQQNHESYFQRSLFL